ncbi:MAG: hypothetical protein ACR2IT_10195 [Pirellulales bacterium]
MIASLSLLGAAQTLADELAASIADTASPVAPLRPDFATDQLRLVEQRRGGWLARAEAATPKLLRTPMEPVALVKVEADAAGFQGWRTVVVDRPEAIFNRPLKPGDAFVIDFGEHLVGYLTISLRGFERPVDAPVRLRLVFGEVPAEVVEPFDPYQGGLSRSWFQDEVVTIDDLPATLTLPRRYAFRYLQLTVVACSTHGRFGIESLRADAVTSADPDRLAAFAADSPEEAAIDAIAVRTLRDCMHTVFEDGPKRDRRLWLGDLRLQAQANYVTYRQIDLVKRSLYLLAGTATNEGLVGTCSFERPVPSRGDNSILDYTALFAATVLDYLRASGDRATAEDLWPLVLRQLAFTLPPVDATGLFIPPKDWWLFVDWHPTLDRQAAEQAIVLFGLRATQDLAVMIGCDTAAAELEPMIDRMKAASRERLWDETAGVYVSGPQRQVSVASQAWMVLAGVPTEEEARRAMTTAIADAAAVKPVTPYMHHHVVEALCTAGLCDMARQYLLDYWGGMVTKGADTFWEVYVPEEEKRSPYGNHLMNSYCHAWSCTPSVFLRGGWTR